jgi:hypothetical protein
MNRCDDSIVAGAPPLPSARGPRAEADPRGADIRVLDLGKFHYYLSNQFAGSDYPPLRPEDQAKTCGSYRPESSR